MGKKAIVQTVVAILLGFDVAVPMYLNARGLFPGWIWQYHALIGFFAFVGFMIWIILEKQRTINKLLDSRPTISVEPVRENDSYYLKVCNNGAEGLFRAQITLCSDDPSVWRLPTYDGYWQKANSNASRIFPNQYDYIKIAERKAYPPDYNSVRLRICYYNPKLVESLSSTGGEAKCDTEDYWLGSYIERPDGTKIPFEKKEYGLNVSISSSPELREGSYNENFKLDINSLRLGIRPQSVSDMEGSQL